MDIRSIQRTGKMYYVYLPTIWVKKLKIGAGSKVYLEQKQDGSLNVSPHSLEREPKDLELTLDESNFDLLQKLIVACYIAPARSFKIHLKDELDFKQLLQQKRLLAVDLVEMDKKTLLCESSIALENPEALLRTMVRKAKNLAQLMVTNYDAELIQRYEEEIDKNKILIEKSIVTALTLHRVSQTKAIDLFYMGIISRSLERLVDHLIAVPKADKKFLLACSEQLELMSKIMDEQVKNSADLNYKLTVEFLKRASLFDATIVKDLHTYGRKRIGRYFQGISETLIDWAIVKKIESE